MHQLIYEHYLSSSCSRRATLLIVRPSPQRVPHHVNAASASPSSYSLDNRVEAAGLLAAVRYVPTVGPQRTARRPPICSGAATATAESVQLEDPVAARLKAWVLGHSKTLPTQLTPVRLANGTYGLVTDEPVRRGQILIRVPRALMLTLETARSSPVCGPVVREAGLTEWQALLLLLLCEMAAGQGSFWAPYLDTLPQDMSHHPLLWPPERVSSWLAGSPLAAQLAGRQAQVADDTEALLVAGANDLPLAQEHLRATGTELVTQGSVGWAAAILLSRSFSLDLSEEEPLEGGMGAIGTWTPHGPNALALVPWADLLQHCSSAGPESCAAYQFDLAAVTLSAHRNYSAGEPVQDSHGQHLSPVDLFLDYGVEDGAAVADLLAAAKPQTTTADAAGSSSSGCGGDDDGSAAAVPERQQQREQAWAGGAVVVVSGTAEGGGVVVSEHAAITAAAGRGGGAEKEGKEEEEDRSQSGRRAGTAPVRHRYDADPSEVVAPRSARNGALLRALAAVQGEGSLLALGERGPDTASLTYLRAALATDAELVRAGWRVKATDRDVELACRVMGSLAEPASAATERALLRALAGYVEAALGRFPTSLEQDLARLAGREGCARVQGPERLAVVAVASQKRALHGTRQAVGDWLARLEAGCDVAELYDEDYDEEMYGDAWGEADDEEGEEEGGWGAAARR